MNLRNFIWSPMGNLVHETGAKRRAGTPPIDIPRAVVAMLAILVASCGVPARGPASQGLSSTDLPTRSLAAASGAVFGLAWLKDGSLVFVQDPNVVGSGTVAPYQTLRLDPKTGGVQSVAVQPDVRCLQSHFQTPSALPDGRIALSEACELSATKAIPDGHRIVGVDSISGHQQILVDNLSFLPQESSWNPAGDRAVTSDFELSLCPALVWLGANGVEDHAINARGFNQDWRLDEPRPGTRGSDCQGLARAQFPRWSPDGKAIAVVASPPSPKDRMARINDPWDLYTVAVGTLVPSRKVTGLLHPVGLAWSPDSQRLAFSARLAGLDGTWIYDLRGGKPGQVSRLILQWLAWSPDGRNLAGLVDKGASPGAPINNQLTIVDLSGILGSGP